MAMSVIMTIFLIVIASKTYRHRDQRRRRTQSRRPGVRQMFRGIESGTGFPATSAAEAKEAALCRLRLDGSLSPAEYQQAMTQLAHRGSNQPAPPR